MNLLAIGLIGLCAVAVIAFIINNFDEIIHIIGGIILVVAVLALIGWLSTVVIPV